MKSNSFTTTTTQLHLSENYAPLHNHAHHVQHHHTRSLPARLQVPPNAHSLHHHHRHSSSSSSSSTSSTGIPTLRLESVKDSLNAVPGFKPGAAFFISLRDNLTLNPPPSPLLNCTMSAEIATPTAGQLGSEELPSAAASSPLDEIPPLNTYLVTDDDEKVDALHLIADSVAQQRQFASSAVIFHPITLALWTVLMGLTWQYLYKVRSDFGVTITTCAGLTMACLAGVRALTGPYLGHAEDIHYSFLTNPDTSEEDRVIVSKYGNQLIGALVLRLDRSSKKRGKTAASRATPHAIIRAWTVKLKYRGKGVGTGLLEEAVALAREKQGRDVEIGFAADHANSKRVLPQVFNGWMDKGEKNATKTLKTVIDGADSRRRR